MTFRFWGVRGSVPCPLSPRELRDKVSSILQRVQPRDLVSPETRERFLALLPDELFGVVGGNTTCLEVVAEKGHVLVVDGGTGLRELGHAHERDNASGKHYHIFLTHFHWDHVQGIPFFAGLQNPRNRVTFYSPRLEAESVVRGQMKAPHFPVEMQAFPARIAFCTLTEAITIAGIGVRWREVNHPGRCVSYRFDRGETSLVFSTDVELRLEDFAKTPENDAHFRGADVLILDAQYTLAEALDRPHWGHTAVSHAVDFALDFEASTLYLFHHEPNHDDAKLEEMGRVAQWYADHKRPQQLRVRVAREGRQETFP